MGEKKDSGLSGEEIIQPARTSRSKGNGVREQDLKDHIGRHLKALYDEVASQPVPDRFKELLDRLDEKMRGE